MKMPIQIEPSANGYVVRPAPSFNTDKGWNVPEWHVFENGESLLEYLTTWVWGPPTK
jgi:hypothetical protein